MRSRFRWSSSVQVLRLSTEVLQYIKSTYGNCKPVLVLVYFELCLLALCLVYRIRRYEVMKIIYASFFVGIRL